MRKDREWKVGDRVKVDGEIGTILYFQPAYWSTHAVLLFTDGDEKAIRLDELEAGYSRLKPVGRISE